MTTLGCVTDSTLDTPSFVSGCTLSTEVFFQHNYNLQSSFLTELCSRFPITASPSLTSLRHGGLFFGGGYNGTIASGSLSPIAGRPAWTKLRRLRYRVDRMPSAALFQPVRLRYSPGD